MDLTGLRGCRLSSDTSVVLTKAQIYTVVLAQSFTQHKENFPLLTLICLSPLLCRCLLYILESLVSDSLAQHTLDDTHRSLWCKVQTEPNVKGKGTVTTDGGNNAC